MWVVIESILAGRNSFVEFFEEQVGFEEDSDGNTFIDRKHRSILRKIFAKSLDKQFDLKGR